jgi:hypothetical protein
MVVVGGIVVVGAMVVVGGIVVVGATVVGNAVVSGGIAASLPEPLVNAVEQPTSATKPKTMPHPMHAVRRSAGATGSDDTWGAVPADCIHGHFRSVFTILSSSMKTLGDALTRERWPQRRRLKSGASTARRGKAAGSNLPTS